MHELQAVNKILSDDFSISGLPKTWLTLDGLHGDILWLLFISNRLQCLLHFYIKWELLVRKVAHKKTLVAKRLLYIAFPFSASAMQTHHTEQQDRSPELQAALLLSEEESSNLIRPQKPLNPLTASRSHQELHKELRMTHKRSDRRTDGCKTLALWVSLCT